MSGPWPVATATTAGTVRGGRAAEGGASLGFLDVALFLFLSGQIALSPKVPTRGLRPSFMISPPTGAQKVDQSRAKQRNIKTGASGWYGATRWRHGGVVLAGASGCFGEDTGDGWRNLTNDPKFEQLAGFPLLAWGPEAVAEDAGESRLDNVAGIAGKVKWETRAAAITSRTKFAATTSLNRGAVKSDRCESQQSVTGWSRRYRRWFWNLSLSMTSRNTVHES